MRVLHVVGARPNFMKAAPVWQALGARGVPQFLVHTGQHYDAKMSGVFFSELGLPEPDVNLRVGSGSHAFQTGEIMKRVEPVLEAQTPDLTLVYGDVNSTLAVALAACKLGICIGHVEAGLRSFDRTMPEEVNRVLTDQISDLLFTSAPEAGVNLLREGIPRGKIHFVGNAMIDSLVRLLPVARMRPTAQKMGLVGKAGGTRPYVLVTLHRPSNVDDGLRLERICQVLGMVGQQCRVVFPVHPRTRVRLDGMIEELAAHGILVTDPLGYLDFLCLQERARAVVTDSGGVQEETTYLGVPCFTLRANTERPITVTCGTNKLVGDDVEKLYGLLTSVLASGRQAHEPLLYWDGRAADRIADVVVGFHK